jgi:hypothetical protein
LIYVFDDIATYAGTVKLTFENDNGDSSTQAVRGDMMLKMGKVHESVEESGIGGQLKIANIDFEFYDRNGIFQNAIFLAPVTKVTCKIAITIGGIDYGVMWGQVDLSTVQYPSYYKGATAERHSVRFTVMDAVKGLDERTFADFIAAVDAAGLTRLLDAPSYTVANSGGVGASFIGADAIINVICSLLPMNVDLMDSRVSMKFKSGAYTDIDFYLILYLYKYSSVGYFPYEVYGRLFDTSEYSLRQYSTCKDILKQVSANFLAYPFFKYSPSTDKVKLILKSRDSGAVIDPVNLGALTKSTLTQFYGYEALRAKYVYDILSGSDTTDPNGQKIYRHPETMTMARFEALKQTFSFDSCFALKQFSDVLAPAGFSVNHAQQIVPHYMGSSVYPLVDTVTTRGTDYTSWTHCLLDNFVAYWGSHNKMYECEYVGTGIGGDYPIQILDRITIDAVNYTVIEINRDLVNNTMAIKAVEYP